MIPEAISESLRSIGPYVEYSKEDRNGVTAHYWVVREKRIGGNCKMAVLAQLGDIQPLSAMDIEEGRHKYEASYRG